MRGFIAGRALHFMRPFVECPPGCFASLVVAFIVADDFRGVLRDENGLFGSLVVVIGLAIVFNDLGGFLLGSVVACQTEIGVDELEEAFEEGDSKV